MSYGGCGRIFWLYSVFCIPVIAVALILSGKCYSNQQGRRVVGVVDGEGLAQCVGVVEWGEWDVLLHIWEMAAETMIEGQACLHLAWGMATTIIMIGAMTTTTHHVDLHQLWLLVTGELFVIFFSLKKLFILNWAVWLAFKPKRLRRFWQGTWKTILPRHDAVPIWASIFFWCWP